MTRVICVALVLAAVITAGVDTQQGGYKVIELTRKDGTLMFIERGKDHAEPITMVVGERLRFENKDKEPHTVGSTMIFEGRPLFSTGVIKPGEYQDLLFDIDLYEQAGGEPANVVTLKYRSDQLGEDSEIRLLSAAKR
ncbi:cupredoxin domain-containing protein [Bradyrhizobium sp. USDA 4520]